MKIKCFGIAKDITSTAVLEIKEDMPRDVKDLKAWLSNAYPAFNNINSCLIAVNQEYADDCLAITASDEIAIIPPVSGG